MRTECNYLDEAGRPGIYLPCSYNEGVAHPRRSGKVPVVMSNASPVERRPASPSPWELAAEAIAVKIRWFGLLIGAVVINVSDHEPARLAVLNAILTLGALYTLLDTWFSLHGEVFLGRSPLVISLMEALFIGLLCY